MISLEPKLINDIDTDEMSYYASSDTVDEAVRDLDYKIDRFKGHAQAMDDLINPNKKPVQIQENVGLINDELYFSTQDKQTKIDLSNNSYYMSLYGWDKAYLPSFDPLQMLKFGITASKNTGIRKFVNDNGFEISDQLYYSKEIVGLKYGKYNTVGFFKWYILYFMGLRDIGDSNISPEIYNNKMIKSWRLNISELCDRLEKAAKEDKDKIRQTLLELGWNPEHVASKTMLQFNRDGIGKALKSRLEMYSLDSILTEASAGPVAGTDKIPIYVLLTSNGSFMSKGIRFATRSEFSHVSISFDSNMNEMYSFSTKHKDNKLGASSFILEAINNEFFAKSKDSKYALYVTFVNANQFDRMTESLQRFKLKNEAKKFKYNTLGILGYLARIPVNRKDAFFCSQFVGTILKDGGVDLTKPTGLIAPSDFANFNAFHYVEDGVINEYKVSRVDRIVKNLARHVVELDDVRNEEYRLILATESTKLLEAKTLPVRLDAEGNLIIKKLERANFMDRYSEAHKLLVIYDKGDNYEGMKYELSKLWFMNSVIENRILHPKGIRKTMITEKKVTESMKARAFILNDFKKYLRIVVKNDPTFNFSEYYQNTPFYDEELKIDKDTIKGLVKFAQSILV